MSCTEWGNATLINVPWIETNWDDPPKCSTCAHLGDLTADDVACCNCCENYSFYEPREETKKMKNNCFAHFIIEGESGSQYGIYNPEANLVMCACCGGILFLDEGVTILETMEIGLEAYDAIMDAFEEERLKKRT